MEVFLCVAYKIVSLKTDVDYLKKKDNEIKNVLNFVIKRYVQRLTFEDEFIAN